MGRLVEQKNRSRLAWFLASLVLGPIATALIVLMARPADNPVEPLHPFTDKADRYFSLAGVIAILTLGVALLTLLGTTWYQWVGGAVAAVVGVVLSVVCVVQYQRARSESRAVAREAASQTPEAAQTETQA